MVQITCEVKGYTHKVIAEHDDPDEAEELAFVANARYEKESGDWACEECVDEHYREGMAEAEKYDKEQRIRQMMEDDRDWHDSILARGDSIRDAHREGK